MYRNALRSIQRLVHDPSARGSQADLPSVLVSALQHLLSTGSNSLHGAQETLADHREGQERCGTSWAATTQEPGCPHGLAQRLRGVAAQQCTARLQYAHSAQLYDARSSPGWASRGQWRAQSTASGGGEGPDQGGQEGDALGDAAAVAADGGEGPLDTSPDQQGESTASTADEGVGAAEAGAGLQSTADGGGAHAEPVAQLEERDSVAEFLASQPPTEPPNPGLRGSAAWEPFADEDDTSFPGIEVGVLR
jgi:hypothetical protein